MKTTTVQPLAAAQVPSALLTIPTVVAVTGLSETTVRRLMSAGKFPAPVGTVARRTRWRAADVTAWLQAQGA